MLGKLTGVRGQRRAAFSETHEHVEVHSQRETWKAVPSTWALSKDPAVTRAPRESWQIRSIN